MLRVPPALEEWVRFDDMLATVLARTADRPGAIAAQWRQLVDLLAQSRGEGDAALAARAVERLRASRGAVAPEVRRDAVAAIAHMPIGIDLVALLADDVPAVAGALIGQVRLTDAQWLHLVPRLGTTGRALLRHRRDLGVLTVTALSAYGATDLLLSGARGTADAGAGANEPWSDAAEAWGGPLADPDPAAHTLGPATMDEEDERTARGSLAEDQGGAPLVGERRGHVVALFGSADGEEQRELPLAGGEGGAEPFHPDAGRSQIRSIISRIARFRSGEGSEPVRAGPLTRFAFEAGRTGIIHYVDAAARGALVGETIARAAAGPFGVDGQAAGAFRKRAAFRSARLVVAGESDVGGEWRIAGVPVFASQDGRFLGYRCTARRPFADETASPGSAARAEDARRGDGLRQIVHELRTPLNAIGGFAEMIRRQMRGPVAGPYRERARDIANQAERLMMAVDDLDVAARLEDARLALQHLPVSLAAVIAPVCGEASEAARAHGLALDVTLPLDLPAVVGDGAAIRRMVARLLAAAAALAQPGEAIVLDAAQQDEGVLLRVARPRRLAGVSEAQLFDPSWRHDEEAADAPLLGLGFSLHLVRRLAAATGAHLAVDERWLTLVLPLAEPAATAIPARS